jgi:chaperonin cofactor prefoldin
MTDGTTGFQVAPISEDDMNKVQSILKRAADAIIGMSQLAADVDMLRSTVAGLQADTDRLRTQNANLDEALAHVRAERDQARKERDQWHDSYIDIETARDNYRNQVDDLGLELSATKDKLVTTLRERDDYGMQVLALEETNRDLQSKLDRIKAAIGDAPTPAMQFEPLPKPEPWPYAEPAPKPEAPLPPVPEQPVPPARAVRYYHGKSWSPGYLWDDEQNEYYTEHAPF